MKKKLLAVLLAATMALGLTACGNGGGAKKVDTREHVKITYMFTGSKPEGAAMDRFQEMNKKLNEILTEKCNAELEFYWIGWTDYLSVYNMNIAAMDGTVDLIGTASDWLDAWPNAKNGGFKILTEDMLKTYAPKTWESVPKDHWELCKYDGDIYLMPEDNYAQWTNHGYIYRLDWAKKAGLANGVKSWEDMTTYFKYVTDNKDALGINVAWDSDGTHNVQMASGWVASHSKFVPVDGICTAALWGGTKDDLYTIVTPAYTDTQMMVDFAKMMKEWDTMGVWKTDVLNNTTSTNRDDYRVGLVAAEQHHTQTWTDLCSKSPSNTIYNDPNAESGFFYFGEETDNVVALSITHGAMAVSAASKNPERALMVYDLLRNDPDCYRLINYGIEGISYEIDSNGYRTTPASYNPDTDNVGGATSWWWGRNDDLELKDATRNWPAIEALYKDYDKIKIDYPYGQFVPDVDSISAKIQNCNEVFGNYMKQIAYGKYTGAAEDIVAEMQAALKQAGIEDVTAELQKQFDALYKK
ncbi:MAG: ABC transporter substrate-binding protein [Lachnospiraceae bacterium]|nr:ABC transporter substrate-binding protein [Lachnospiraceae bacterium]